QRGVALAEPPEDLALRDQRLGEVRRRQPDLLGQGVPGDHGGAEAGRRLLLVAAGQVRLAEQAEDAALLVALARLLRLLGQRPAEKPDGALLPALLAGDGAERLEGVAGLAHAQRALEVAAGRPELAEPHQAA